MNLDGGTGPIAQSSKYDFCNLGIFFGWTIMGKKEKVCSFRDQTVFGKIFGKVNENISKIRFVVDFF